jgi:ribosomal protein S12
MSKNLQKNNQNVNPPIETPPTEEVTLAKEAGIQIQPSKEEEPLLARLEQRVEIYDKIISLILKFTKPQDWMDFGGKPFLTSYGAERIRPHLGIKILQADFQIMRRKDKEGKEYELVVYHGLCQFRDDVFPAIGLASTKNTFYRSRKETDPETGKEVTVYLPYEEVDISNIIQHAYSMMIRNAVTRVIGLRNLSWEQLEKAGLKIEDIPAVRFKRQKEAERNVGRKRKEKREEEKKEEGKKEEKVKMISEDQIRAIETLRSQLKWDEEQLKNYLWAHFGKEYLTTLTYEEASKVISSLQEIKRKEGLL